MPASKQLKFEYRIARQRREAARTAVYREAANDAPACPWIYRGFEEPPKLGPRTGGSVDAAPLEGRLHAIDRAAYTSWRRNRHADVGSAAKVLPATTEDR